MSAKATRPRRIAMRIALCVVGGVAVNVLVAEACALWTPLPVRITRQFDFAQRGGERRYESWRARDIGDDALVDRLLSAVPSEWARQFLMGRPRAFEGYVEVREGRCVRVECLRTSGTGVSEMLNDADAIVVRAGWPARAMDASRAIHHDYAIGLPEEGWSGGTAPKLLWPRVDLDGPMGGGRGSPIARPLLTQILWPGFLLNTAAYSAALGVLLFAPAAVRSIHRPRAGRCPACGYSRAGLADGSPCPECGAAA